MNEIKNPADLLQYMENNFQYGWVGIDNTKHIKNLKGFRKFYRISSIEKILETKLTTCIESAKFAKAWFDSKNIESKLFCERKYETKPNEEEIEMHIFIFFQEGDQWYQFEHSNRPERGIYKYNSLEEAISNKFNKKRELTEIKEIPTGLSFLEFNQYVNNIEKDIKNSQKTK